MFRSSISSRFVLFVSLSIIVFALGCLATAPKFSFKYGEHRAVLSNGIKVVVLPVNHSKTIEVDVRYDVGSAQDPKGKAGLAHLVEHMMFQHKLLGPKQPPTFDILPDLAVFFNAYTNWDSTHYMVRATPDNLDKVINLEASRFGFGCHTLTQEEFNREREVVRNEIRQRTGTAEGQIFQLLLSEAYPQGHPYREMIGGNDKELSNITLKDVCEFFDNYYIPERTTVIVAGPPSWKAIDSDKAIPLVTPKLIGQKVSSAFGQRTLKPKNKTERYIYGRYNKKGRGPQDSPIVPITLVPHEVTKAFDVEQSMLHVIWPVPDQYGKHGNAVNGMIGSVATLFEQFSDDWELCDDISVGLLGGVHAGIFSLSCTMSDNVTKDEVLSFVWKSADGASRLFREGKLLKEQRSRQKQQIVLDIERIGNRTQYIGDQVQFNKNISFTGDSNQFKEYMLSEFEKIDTYDGTPIKNFIDNNLHKDNAIVVLIQANKQGVKGDKRASLVFKTKSHDKTSKNFLLKSIHPLAVKEYRSPLTKASRYTLENGMQVILLPFSDWPVANISLLFNAGTAYEETAGLAGLANNYLRLPSDSQIAVLGAHWSSGYNTDHAWFGVKGINLYTQAMLKGLERKIYAGDYPQKVLERVHQQRDKTSKSNKFKSQVRMERVLHQALYGKNHPYTTKGNDAITTKQYQSLGKDATNAFRTQFYTATNATLVVSGSFDENTIRNDIESIFGDWKTTAPVAGIPKVAIKRTRPSYYGVVAKKQPQMTISIAYPSTSKAKDNNAEQLILREMLNLRMADIRTRLGSTYGIYASLSQRVAANHYRMGGNVDIRRAGESLAAMRKGIADLRRGKNLTSDFVKARQRVLQRLLKQPESSGEIVAQITNIAAFDQALNYQETLLQTVNATSVAQIKAFIIKELNPRREIIAVLADKKTIAKTFVTAKLPSPTYVDSTATH